MFGVLALFVGFVALGKPLGGVALLFVAAICVAGLLGCVVAVVYAEPMNLLIRRLEQQLFRKPTK